MTKVFPQLVSGAVTQFPFRLKERTRTLLNQMPDGRRIRYSDLGASTIAWELSHSGLSDEEFMAIEALFVECEGRRHSFLFIDPWSNLIKSSEAFGDSAWTLGPGLGLSEGLSDPEGRPRATQVTNAAGALQSITQTVTAPSEFQFSFSIYARAASPTQLRLIVSTDGAFVERLFDLSSDWQRYSLFSSLAVANDAVEVSVQLPSGATVELFGAQLEAQPASSPYQRTTLRTGLYPDSRFAGDTLTQVSTSPGEHSTVLRIVSRVPVDA